MNVFVDTGAWFALFVKRDPEHLAAKKWLAENSLRLVTSDYVLDELFTLLKIRESHKVAVAAGEVLLQRNLCHIARVTPEDFTRAWEVFVHFKDKGWSFTDCTSKVLIERLQIPKAFAFDEHFEQFGAVVRVP
ncbi:MAG: PIN domain-containing protein [bacterium]